MPIFKVEYLRGADLSPIRVDTVVADRLAEAIVHGKSNYVDVCAKHPNNMPHGFRVVSELGEVLHPFTSLEASPAPTT